jgi:NTE family protein
MKWPSLKIALALGGGGARGLAHVGAIRVLGEAGLTPDFVIGTSSGAIVGGAYALSGDATALRARLEQALSQDKLRRMESRLRAVAGGDRPSEGWAHGLIDAFRRLVLWNRQALQQSLIDGAIIEDLIDTLVRDASFEDLKVPFHAVAFDLRGVEDVILSTGRLATAIRASSAVPGVFKPVESDERLLVDGAVFHELPSFPARQLGAEFVLAVDVGSQLDPRTPSSAAEVMSRVLQVRGERLRLASHAAADFVIRPRVGSVHWSEFSRADECYAAGALAAHDSLDELQRAMRRVWRRGLLPRIWRRLLRSAPRAASG